MPGRPRLARTSTSIPLALLLAACAGQRAPEQPATERALSLALPTLPLPRGAREITMKAGGGIGGMGPTIRVTRSANGRVEGEMLVELEDPETSRHGGRFQYVAEMKARYAKLYGCDAWALDRGVRGMQLCRVPFRDGEPEWAVIFARLDSLVRNPAPPETLISRPAPPPPDTRTRAERQRQRREQGLSDDYSETLPVDRIRNCLDRDSWEIVEWTGSTERRISPPATIGDCAPSTEAGKAYEAAGWNLYGEVVNKAQADPSEPAPPPGRP